MLFSHTGLECKSRKSRNTWNNRQIWPCSTNEAGQRLIETCQENALIIANTLFQQYKRRLYTWTVSWDVCVFIHRIIRFSSLALSSPILPSHSPVPGKWCFRVQLHMLPVGYNSMCGGTLRAKLREERERQYSSYLQMVFLS